MSIFQKSVVNKYLRNLDNDKVNNAFDNFKDFYGNKLRLHNIMQLKEENYQEGFLREVFVHALGYSLNPTLDFNLTTEFKNQSDSKKADGAIIKNNLAIGVIELKSTKTLNLDSITNQAFNYKHNQTACRYIITSNFHHLRFFIDNSTEYEEFDLFEMTANDFKLFYLVLSQESIFNDVPLKMKEETKYHEESITDKFYRDYKAFKDEIFDNLIKNNSQYDKLTLFKKSQKLLDRFLFVLFAEDSGLCPPNSVQMIIDQWKRLQDDDVKCTLYSHFQKMFGYLNKGYKGKHFEFPAYNGGLFLPDDLLDNENIAIDDFILLKHCPKLSAYDFNTDIDVNILGHIFEHSLNEIDEITAELKGETVEKTKSKRKKEGVFYTPKYITNYIVENTIGKLCKDKQEELKIAGIVIDETYIINSKITKQGKELYIKYQEYKNWLLTLKILDPACGSGAFLNAALDFLIKEHQQIDDLISDLTGDRIRMFDTDKNILENNIFGVDINEESVDIAKLSLWLRTAKKDRKLSDLNNNIKCGNSLIDNKDVAGDKAFNWHKEFPQIFGVEVKKTELVEIKKEAQPDYIKLIKEKSLEAKMIAEKAKELSNAAIEITQKVYEYAEQLETLREPEVNYNITKNVGFDVVIGNPPYGANISNDVQKYLNDTYIQGASETAIAFLKLSYSLLKRKGILGFIIPKSFSFSSNYNAIRTFLKDDILEIVDCKKVWKEVKLEQVIVRFQKNTPSLLYLSSVLKQQEIIEVGQINKNTFNDYGFFLNDVNDRELGIANKMKKSNLFLNDIATNSRGGIFQKYLTKEGEYKVLGGAEIQRYGIVGIKGMVKAEIIEDERNASLNDNSVLVQRIVAHIENPKEHIKITACLPSELDFKIVDTINQITINNLNSNKYIWILLNSNLINWFAYRFIYGKAIRTMQFDNPVTSRIPIANINLERQQPFIEKADIMLSLNNELQTKSNKFIKRIKSNFANINITNKLSDFYEHDFNTVISELKKQKIIINLKNQDEWEEYFDTYKKEINELRQQINHTDKEIDKMVYNLYELTSEEITLVEGND